MKFDSKPLFGLILATIVVGLAALSFLVGSLTHLPDFKQLRREVKVPIKLANKTKSERWVGPIAPSWVPVSEISNPMLMAVIASEDTSFFSHKGVDYHELGEAIKTDLREKRWARGASTLTEQLVKNVYLGKQKTLWRKLKEFLWARELEKVLSKSEILCFYLNMAEWGPGIYGIGAAAQHYFNETPAEITAKQAAFLAMLLPSPRRYHSYYVHRHLSPWAEGRVKHILHVMNQMGFIDEAVYTQAVEEKLWGVATSESESTEENVETATESPSDLSDEEEEDVSESEEVEQAPAPIASPTPSPISTDAPVVEPPSSPAPGF